MSGIPIRLSIDQLGAQGDGVAATERGPVHIPFTLPGETVNAAVSGGRGDLMAVIEASPLRVEPPCRHFGTCGGCALQHMEPVSYAAWKRDLVVQALKSRGIDAPVDPLVACAPQARRRAAFTARRLGGRAMLGYSRARSHDLVDIEECPILLPAIVEALPTLRRLAVRLGTHDKPFRMLVTATASGLDVAAEGQGRLADKDKRDLAAFAIEAGLARLSADGEIIVEPRRPVIDLDGVALEPPPGGFLQAVADAETAMVALVAGHLGGAKKVADLFSGAGAFALRLARASEVHAVESDPAALGAMDRAFRFASGLKRITYERRDLFRRPLTTKDLAAFAGVVFDPPRAGAEDQARQLAKSSVPRVAAVSCNPATLARDLRILLDGGYALRRVVPVDQFLWSPHVEAVALLDKPVRRR